MNVEASEAHLVKHPPSHQESAALNRRASRGRRIVQRYLERLRNTAGRLKDGPEAGELLAAAADLREGQGDHQQAAELFAQALSAFGLSREAHLGMRRVSRRRGDSKNALEALRRDIANAAGERRRALRFELVRTHIYLLGKPRDALVVLEEIEHDDKAEKRKDWMGTEVFFLWEDVLWATAQWKRYEDLLRASMRHRDLPEGLAEMLERRLLVLYETILPDERQASIIINHLLEHGELDGELVDFALRKLAKEDAHDDRVEVLTRALSECPEPVLENVYRMLLSDIARYHFEDPEHAADIVRAGLEGSQPEPLLVHELLDLQEERADVSGLVDALGFSLEIIEDPAERADVLHRIGTLLLDHFGLEDAAEEVILEGLRDHPVHRPSLRTMGRIFSARQDFDGLARLYEDELELSEDENRWRKHFKLAEIYEDELRDRNRAFTHYVRTLDLRPAYLPALQGASRLAPHIGLWAPLLERYAAAENATEDPRQRIYLLERIAQIAEEHMGDLITARKALEGLRMLEPRHPGALASLQRIYNALGLSEELVALRDEELEHTGDSETAATLLASNGDTCCYDLNDDVRAEAYYRLALEKDPTFLPALEGLGRMLQRLERWEDLVVLGIEEAEAWGDSPASTRRLHVVGELLERKLDQPDTALEVYWTCLERDPTDRVSRDALIRLYSAQNNWEKVCEVLEVEAKQGGRGNYAAATFFRLAQIKAHRLDDPEGAYAAYEQAFVADPGSPILLRMWLNAARSLGRLEAPREILAAVSGRPENARSRVAVLSALTTFCLLDTHDPLTAAGYLDIIHELAPEHVSRNILYPMALARRGRWDKRRDLAIDPGSPPALRHHAFLASLAQGVPESVKDVSRELLISTSGDVDEVARCWGLFPIVDRPEPEMLPTEVRASASPEAQVLRRWSAVTHLETGAIEDPAGVLLPRENASELSLRADMELLAASYEQAEQWDKLIEVLLVQEELAPHHSELVHLNLERAQVLERTGRANEALEVVHEALVLCDFDQPIRNELYHFLESREDWAFLVEELRRHLQHIDEPLLQAKLWRRLSRILEQGIGDLDEALRSLDAAYRSFPEEGELLVEIARLAEDLGEVAIARRAVNDYLIYHQPPIEAEIELASTVVRLHVDSGPGGDVEQLIDWLEDLVERSCDDPRAMRCLAEAHARAGSPFIATDLILRLVRLPYVEDDLELWMLLASLYGGPMDEIEKAEDLYWELLANFSHRDDLWEDIDAFYMGPRGRIRLVEKLSTLLDQAETLGIPRESQRRYFGELAHLLGEELGRWKEAQMVYAKAIELASVPAPDLAKRRAYAMVRVPGQNFSAYRQFCDLLIDDPFQPDVVQAAVDLCKSVEAYDRARILKQVAKFFTPEAGLHLEDEHLRPKIQVTRVISDEALKKHLLFPQLRGQLYDVLHEAQPIFEQLYKDTLPKLSDVSGKRIRGRHEMVDIFGEVGSKLGINSFKLFLGNDESPEPMVFASPNAFWFPNDAWNELEEAGRRHWAGYASGLLWTGISNLAYLHGRELWQILDGVYYTQTGDSLSPLGKTAYTIEAGEKVKSPFNRRARKEIVDLLKVARDEIFNGEESHQWTHWIRSTGDRTGLLFSGDLGTSVRALLAGEGWRGEITDVSLKRQLQHAPRLKLLLEFALSEDYLHLRYEAGLALRPSNFKD